MLTITQKLEITNIVKESLARAEKQWAEGGHELVIKSSRTLDQATETFAEAVPSSIPGHGIVQDRHTVIDEFIAFVADMRDSSKHLLNEISIKTAKVSRLQRVFYETSALLPAIAKSIKYNNGNVTEYLGDGVLALFQVDKDDRKTAIYASHAAANDVITCIRDIVNECLYFRYNLPPIDLGVGLSLSKCLVTAIGLEGEKHPKAIGECVYRATKLSGGRNEIYIDEYLKSFWPTSNQPSISFRKKDLRGQDGYLIQPYVAK